MRNANSILSTVKITTNLFVNLPVKDINRSKDFFMGLGFTFKSQFSNERSACMVVGEETFIILLSEPAFQAFTKKAVTDTSRDTEVLIGLSADKREKVDEIIQRAIHKGGREARAPRDQGFMYGRGFEDLDGHIWEVMWMDPRVLN